jgi:sirohydrochlorin ferrochelatase
MTDRAHDDPERARVLIESLSAQLERARHLDAARRREIAALITRAHKAEASAADANAQLYRARQALQDLADGSDRVQCLAAKLGEGTYECDISGPCLACRARARMASAAKGETT